MMKKFSIALTLTILLTLVTNVVTLAAPPSLPSTLYGTVEDVSGTDAPPGVPVEAWINGVKVAETATTVAGDGTVYVIDVPGDDPDTPAIEGGQEGDVVTFRVAGFEAGQTTTWGSGGLSQLNLTATFAPQARFSIGKGMNTAQLEDGAQIVAYSSVWGSHASYQPENAIDANAGSYWRTANGQTTDQWIKVRLPGDDVHVVDRVVLKGSASAFGLQDFEIRVSTTGPDDADFTTVFTGTVPQDSDLHEFAFSPVYAKYVQLFVVNNWGFTSDTRVYHFQVWTRDRQGGIVSLSEGPPAAIVDYSSQEGNSGPENMIDESSSSIWRSAYQQVTDQWAKVELGGGAIYTVDRVRLQSNYNPEAPKDFEIRVSDTVTDDLAFTTVFSGTMVQDTNLQEFTFAPVQARYVQLFVKNGYGSSYIRVNTFQVLTPDGANVARLEGVGAFVLGHSSQYGSYDPGKAIDFSTTSFWQTASGQATDQWFKVRLVEGVPRLVDRVKLQGPGTNQAPREFQIRVSNDTLDDADFVTVFSGSLPQDTHAHWFTFSPVEAKYVQLFILNNHGHTAYIRLNDFQVYSPHLGGARVPLDDFSVDSAGRLADWHWDFGDGVTSTEQHPVHTYAAPGTYTVTLTVTDDDGHSDATTMDYTVLRPPTADFDISPVTPDEGQRTYFYDTSTDADGSIEGWRWRFSHTSDRTTQDTSLIFSDNGDYPVTLEVTDSQLLTATVIQTATVLNAPPTVDPGPAQTLVWEQDWSASPSVSDPGSADRSSLVCDWDFGDGQTAQVVNCNTSSIRQVKHAYATPGVYTATLTVTDKDGDSASDDLTVTVDKRDSFVNAYVASGDPIAGEVETVVRLYDYFDLLSPLPNQPVTIDIGSQAVTVTTDAEGVATAQFSTLADFVTLTASFAGDDLYYGSGDVDPFNMTQPLPRGDVVFIVDESASMGSYINQLKAQVSYIAHQLGAETDFQLGLLGFGLNAPAPHTRIHTALTDDVDAFDTGVNNLTYNYGPYEAGFNATVVGMRDHMGFRPDAGVCAILIADEDADVYSHAPETKADALAALNERQAVFLAIVKIASGTSADDYGPNPGSLAAETNGTAIEIRDFLYDPEPVLTAILDNCINNIFVVTAPDLAISKDDGHEEAQTGQSLTYTLTISNVGENNAVSVVVTDTLPAYTTFITASHGGTYNAGAVVWPAFSLPSGASADRTVTVRVQGPLPTDTVTITNTATTADHNVGGADQNPDDNETLDTTLIVEGNAPPALAPIGDQVVDEGTTLDVAVSASDPDDDPVILTASGLPAFTAFTDNGDGSGILTLLPGFDDAGQYPNVEVSASDGALTATETLTVTVNDVNRPPVADAGGPYVADEGDTITLDGSASSDPDGDALSHRWQFQGQDHDGATVAVVADDDFSGAATLTVDDGRGETAIATATVTIRNVAPTVNAGPDQATDEGGELVFSGTFGDPGALDTHTVEWDFGDGSATSDQLIATHTYTAPGTYTATLTVTDDDDGVGVDEAIITVNPLNSDPVAVDDTATTNQDTPVTIDVLANDSDPDGDPLNVISVTQPLHGSAAVVSQPSSAVVYTPTTGFHGTDTFSYTTSDSHGGSDSATVRVTVQSPGSWYYPCDDAGNLQVDVIGAGMGHGDAVEHNPQTLILDDPGSVASILAQVMVNAYATSPPDQVVVSSALETHTLTESLQVSWGHYYEVTLQPSEQITAEVVGNVGHKPRAFAAYVFRQGDGEGASSGGLVHEYVYHDSHSQVVDIPTASFARDVAVTFAVADVEDDSRTVALQAEAGGVSRQATLSYPNRGSELLVYTLNLPNVPGGADAVTVTLRSPSSDGDSLFWSGVNVAAACRPHEPVEGRVAENLQALYTFQEGDGTTVHDVSGVGQPLDLSIAGEDAVTWLAGGLSIEAETLIASAGAASKVINAAQASHELTLEAWVKPANATQDGPARIVTLSQDPNYRDLTLGQGLWGDQPSDVYDVRLRTTGTGDNGTPSVTTPEGALTTELSHVVYTRDAAGTAHIYVDGAEVVSETVGGDLSSWDSNYRLALANELTKDRPWLGELHLVAIYDRALTPAEVSQNYDAGPD